MIRFILWLLATGLFVLLPVSAQSNREIAPYVTFEGAITEDMPEERWAFDALAGEVISVVVEGDGDFDPQIAIVNSEGDAILQNDDAAYPFTSDAVIEAMTIPRTGAYTVVVHGFDGDTGTYTLLFLHGYATMTLQNAVDNAGWARVSGDITVDGGDTLTVSLEGINQIGIAGNRRLPDAGDFYAELGVETINARNDWTIGLALRQQSTRMIIIAVNARGQWRADLIAGEERTTLRDWTPHPAIVPDQTAFTLGVMGIGGGFDVFYDNQFMGQIIVDGIANQGGIGVMVGTADAINSMVEAQFSSLAITTPREVGDDGLFPLALIPGTQTQLVQELERRRVIPVGGQLALSVGESFSESARPGVALVELGRGTTFTNFVMATTTTIDLLTDTGAGPTGCGLLLRRTDEDNYTVAYVDSDGGYGVSERETGAFLPGLYAETPAYADLDYQELLIVLLDDTLHYYVNRRYAGRLTLEPVTGIVGNVQVNFEANNATCGFRDTWLWTWANE